MTGLSKIVEVANTNDNNSNNTQDNIRNHNLSQICRTIESKRGGQKIEHEGYIYTKERNIGS
ncbi:hypothetical protein HZS_1397 [Henneguya salminicola]|nr:hypothetical protein HZS_1397 [Henneguya salminicola]